MEHPVAKSAPGRSDQIPADGEAVAAVQAEVPAIKVGGVVQIDQQAPAADEKPGIGSQQGGKLSKGKPGGQHLAPGGVDPHLMLVVLRPQDVPQAQADGLPAGAQLQVFLRGGEQPRQLVKDPLQLRRRVGLDQILRRLDPVALQGVVGEKVEKTSRQSGSNARSRRAVSTPPKPSI